MDLFYSQITKTRRYSNINSLIIQFVLQNELINCSDLSVFVYPNNK